MSNSENNLLPTPPEIDFSKLRIEGRVRRRNERLRIFRNYCLSALFILCLIPAIRDLQNYSESFLFHHYYSIYLTNAKYLFLVINVILVLTICFWVIRLNVFEDTAKSESGFYIVCIYYSGETENAYTFNKGFRTSKQAKRFLNKMAELQFSTFNWINNEEVIGVISKSNSMPVGKVRYFIHFFNKAKSVDLF
ncbi:MAG: hypothetical protein IAE96_04700 [Chitinophagaceae bacterium]|nr:hypothetical protein [Chitinophagaceae bacterium]